MVEIPFFKKLSLPKFALAWFGGKPNQIVGVDIALHSTKVVQLRYESERAILETYGELLSEGYLKGGGGFGSGILRHTDADAAALLKDVLRESNITAKDAVFSVPAPSSFITTVTFPNISDEEINQAVPFEARKYVPIPISEIALDWEILDRDEEKKSVSVLLVAVPKEVIEKFKRIAELAGLTPRALEVESFSIIRSLIGQDPTPTAIINLGHQSTTLALVDKRRLRISHNFDRGSQELTRALERGLSVSRDRAEAIKMEVGLSERIEEREITSVMIPLMETLFTEIERLIAVYNRKAPRKIQKANLTGGGSNLKGIVDYASNKLGIEVVRGNPFARVVTPAFLQPALSEIGPSFSVAVGLALHEITS